MNILGNIALGVMFFASTTLIFTAPKLIQYFGNLMLNM